MAPVRDMVGIRCGRERAHGEPGAIWSGLAAEGIDVIVAVGLEKLVPGAVEDAIRACGRRRIDLAMGMAVDWW